MRRALFITLAASTILAAPVPAHADTIVFCGPDTEGGTCEGVGEQKVFLDPAKAVLTSVGDIGSPGSNQVLVINSLAGPLNQFYDSAGGFGTITPADLHPGGKQKDFNGLSFQISGFNFTDMVFDVQLTPSSSPTDSFVATVFGPGHTFLASNTFSDKPDTDKQFGITDTNGLISEVDILSATGFDEVKHIEMSGVTSIPEPSTWVMLIGGFSLMALFSAKRARGDRFAPV